MSSFLNFMVLILGLQVQAREGFFNFWSSQEDVMETEMEDFSKVKKVFDFYLSHLSIPFSEAKKDKAVFTWYYDFTSVISKGGFVIMTNPIFKSKNFSGLDLDIKKFHVPNVDLVLLSDSLSIRRDKEFLNYLQMQSSSTIFLGPSSLKPWFESHVSSCNTFYSLDPWQTLSYGPYKITVLPTYSQESCCFSWYFSHEEGWSFLFSSELTSLKSFKALKAYFDKPIDLAILDEKFLGQDNLDQFMKFMSISNVLGINWNYKELKEENMKKSRIIPPWGKVAFSKKESLLVF